MTNEAAERLRVEIGSGAEYPERRRLLLADLDAALAAERKAGATEERERQIAVRKDWGTLPHGQFHEKYGRIAQDLHLLPTNCSCRECRMWSD